MTATKKRKRLTPDLMSPRERLLAWATGKPIDRLPFIIHWGPWAETIRRWRGEGMKRDGDWHALFGFDPYLMDAGVASGICPAFKEEVLADEGETVVVRDSQGVVKRDRKDHNSIPAFLEYPVRDRQTWEEHKWRFDPDTPERFPKDWPARARALRNADAVTALGVYPYGFFGGPRTMMGAVGCLMACALDPALIEDINRHLAALWHRLWRRVFEETRIDAVYFWEDMAGKQGAMISPAMFRRFMTPHYRRLTELARRHGVKILSVDSDGNMHGLTPLFIEAGVPVIYPYEVQAGNDLPRLVAEHPGLYAMGGMDKRAMASGRRAIDAEMRRVRAMLPLGRCLPFPDHLIPPDVPWENYQHFVWRWKEMIGKQ
jgi:uroporphyrinogen decarboxylase